MDPTLLKSYSYHLPEELIAKKPASPRDSSRLMVIERSSGTIRIGIFRDLLSLVGPHDRFVVNNTKVFKARLLGMKPGTGGKCEVFLLKEISKGRWQALVRPGKKMPHGTVVEFSPHFYCQILDTLPDGSRIVQFPQEVDVLQQTSLLGHIPLPHYIQRDADDPQDEKDYQTSFASRVGANAAPTAGLHFTDELVSALKNKGNAFFEVTLHVGLGTFRPVQVEDIREHKMHSEWCEITSETASALNQACRGREIAVGTTSCRTLESFADERGQLSSGCHETDIFIYPGYRFKRTNALLTNFHLPESSLLMLVSAFAGPELIKEAYSKAIEERMRFYSYGDAMLIL
ncbi:tRNA preQ1(34) S-adenosylmethionine ribosyltransferase-isomerase QueA [Estrella lausannensis]|nr:tRNA preQ1(34) S-adenosylmethionine ribosyltransferase-isomerase QueA [Estrella lausannensis]